MIRLIAIDTGGLVRVEGSELTLESGLLIDRLRIRKARDIARRGMLNNGGGREEALAVWLQRNGYSILVRKAS